MQDLTRIDDAVARRRARANAVLRDAFAGARSRAPDRARLGRRRALRLRRTCEALIALARRARVPDLVLHAFTDGRDTLPHSGAGFLATVEGWMAAAGVGRIGSVSGATTRWTATGAGSGSSAPTTCWSTAAASSRRRAGRTLHATRTSATRPTSSSRRRWSARPAPRIRAGRLGVRVQLPPRPDARDHARAAEPGFTEVDRGGAAPVDALHDDDRVRGGLAVPGRVPAGSTRR